MDRRPTPFNRGTVSTGLATSSVSLACFILLIHFSTPVIGAPQNNNNAAGGGSILTMAADDLIQPSASWLLERSKQSGSWGVDTPRALLALLRVIADRSATTGASSTVNFNPNSLQGLILRQEFDIQLLLFQLRNQGSTPQEEQANTLEPSRSLFALTLTAMCRNPRDFYGQDILAPILVLEEDHDGKLLQPFTFAFNAMAVCAGGGHLKRRHVVKLLESINQPPVQTHSIDLLAMVVLATSCLYQSSPKYRHLQDFLEQPLKMIAAQQQPDGSFDHNVATTALAIQALKIPGQLLEEQPTAKPISLPAWRPDLTVDWLRSQQKADGSFGDLFTTSEVLLALATQPGYGFLYSQCSNLNNQSGQLNTTTTEPPPTIPTTIPSAGSLGGDPAQKVHFTYVVWIGQNRSDVYAIQLTVPANSSFYEAMKIAAEADPRFEFSASVWPNGHYIHTIGGHRDQYIGFHFWLLFCMPMMPDPADPPSVIAPHYVAVGGVDDMFPKNGDYYLFWYKDV
ncbi:uncharacterized protein CG3556-like [Daphnia pulicaria]|uniref:uncharacterized protein CG3556-like n=1 Tax=Daphnia pulicaria TaxID=35523 RepID=UPI001EEA54D6|nr:uncharacterized protein CG3556-like [Daphnia pulicaria]